SNAFALCELIARVWKHVGKIKLILVTNKVNKAQSDALPIEPIHGVPVTMNVWDLTRLYKFIASGQTREELVIDFAEDFGSPVPLLRASEESAPFDSYIGVISGAQLAAIYDKWGARLLEANVRSFLQA